MSGREYHRIVQRSPGRCYRIQERWDARARAMRREWEYEAADQACERRKEREDARD